jgi:hypothetical protein
MARTESLPATHSVGSLPTGTVPMSLTPAKRRFRSPVSRDRKGKRTAGSVYARHRPECNLLIDFTQFFQYAHTNPSKAVAMATVMSYLESYKDNPIRIKHEPLQLRFAEWERVGPEVHWYFFGYAAIQPLYRFTHAVTINFSGELIHRRFEAKAHGPARILTEDIIRGLFTKPFRRAGVPLIYAYAIEMHHKPDGEGGRERGQQGLVQQLIPAAVKPTVVSATGPSSFSDAHRHPTSSRALCRRTTPSAPYVPLG